MPYPLELDLERTRRLRIRWSDGTSGEIPLAALRQACPCAACRAQREEQSRNPLAVVPAAGDQARMVTVETADLAGNYALRVTWKDGHGTGIYDFGLLYRLCNSVAGPVPDQTGKAGDNPGAAGAC